MAPGAQLGQQTMIMELGTFNRYCNWCYISPFHCSQSVQESCLWFLIATSNAVPVKQGPSSTLQAYMALCQHPCITATTHTAHVALYTDESSTESLMSGSWHPWHCKLCQFHVLSCRLRARDRDHALKLSVACTQNPHPCPAPCRPQAPLSWAPQWPAP